MHIFVPAKHHHSNTLSQCPMPNLANLPLLHDDLTSLSRQDHTTCLSLVVQPSRSSPDEDESKMHTQNGPIIMKEELCLEELWEKIQTQYPGSSANQHIQGHQELHDLQETSPTPPQA
jgi:hypothetical protein